jgi:uncharacterized membrane protein
MTTDNPDQNNSSQVPGNEGQDGARNHHSSGRHHHSHRHSRSPGSHSGEGRRFRLEDQPRRSQVRKIESFLSKHFLKVAGIVFIFGAVWLSLGSIQPLKDAVTTVRSTAQTLLHGGNPGSTAISTLKSIQSGNQEKPPASPAGSTAIPIVISVILILVVLYFSIRMKRIEIESIALTFWILFGAWWFIKVLSSGQSLLTVSFLATATIIYLAFFVSNLFRSYYRERTLKRWLEFAVIAANTGFYYLAVLFILHYYGYGTFSVIFTVFLVLMNITWFYFAGKKDLHYQNIPYLMVTGILVSMILPMLFRTNYLVLFFSVLSIVTMLHSKYTRHQNSILFSVGAMTVMLVAFAYHLLFQFLPVLLSANPVPERAIFYKGAIACVAVLITFSINSRILKKLEITLSRKWFSRGTYRKIIKGILLLLIYISIFWIYSYFVSLGLNNTAYRYLVWFLFNSLFFIVAVPALSMQHSSFRQVAIVLASLSMLLYPVVIRSFDISIRDTLFETHGRLLHYLLLHAANTIAAIVLLVIVLRYAQRSFSGRKIIIKAFWTYLSVLGMYLLLTEFSFISVLISYRSGKDIDDALQWSQTIPYSLIIIVCAILLMVLGFIRQTRYLRIYALILLLITLVKILVIDIPAMETTGRTLVFLCLGIGLLGISFFYSRVKHFFLQKNPAQGIAAKPDETYSPPQHHHHHHRHHRHTHH